MRTPSTVLSTAALLCLALPFSGCKSSQPAPVTSTTPQPAPGQPVTPDSNTAMTPNGTVAPTTTTGSAAPAPMAMTAAPAAPAPAPALVVPAGTRATIRLNQALSAQRNDVGDGFSGVLNAPIVVRGVTAFPRGTRVSGTVIAAKGKGRFKGEGILGIELTQIGGLRVQTSEYEAVGKGRGKRTAGFIGGGAGVGALIGGLAGGGKGALIGGLAGAGGGTAASAYTGNRDVVISAESVITFRLTSSITVR